MTPALSAPFELIDLGIVASTNDEALRLAHEGAPEWTVVRAVEQRAGRGRRGKSFVSPPGNSYTSFLLRPNCRQADAPQIALVAGLAVALAVDRLAPDLGAAQCKWPNDVLVQGSKVCGILVEAVSTAGKLDAVVVGIGVNLVSHPEIDGLHISDLQTLGAIVDRDAWLGAMAPQFRLLVDRWSQAGFSSLRELWLGHAAGLHRRVTHLEDRRAPLYGVLNGVDENGALLIADGAGTIHRCVSGSLVLEDVS